VNITPSLTRKFGDKAAGDNTYPIIDEKTISTIFNLASGQTAAIGGLTEVEDSQIERKVPLLGSIPYLGRLFSWKQTVSDQRETVIFVTVALANTMDIDAETGLPADSELARRRIIKDRNQKVLRTQGREYYQTEEDNKLDDMLKVMRQQEAKRVQKRGGDVKNETELIDELAELDKNEAV
jgi:type II secretory pathway component GspD/PulD (secretin)